MNKSHFSFFAGIAISFMLLANVYFSGCESAPSVVKGERRYYYADGSIKAILKVDSLGRAEGIAQYFDEHGRLKQTSTYHGDTLDGEIKTYYPSGKLESVTNKRDGKSEGEARNYYESGAISVRGYFVGGLSHGLFTKFNENGSKKNEYLYDHDSRISYIEYGKDETILRQSIVIELSVPFRDHYALAEPIPILVTLRNVFVQTDSMKAYIRICSQDDTLETPLIFEGESVTYNYVPNQPGICSILVYATDWANPARGVVFKSRDSTSIVISKNGG